MKFLILILATMLTMMASNAYADMVTVANDTCGVPRCFYADSNGQAYGNSLDDADCGSGYAINDATDGSRQCFHTYTDGSTYGTAVNPKLCQ